MKITCGWTLVTYTCNLSYSSSRDQEDHVSRPVWATKARAYLKKMQHKKGLVE
jgi:hypothetical protein